MSTLSLTPRYNRPMASYMRAALTPFTDETTDPAFNQDFATADDTDPDPIPPAQSPSDSLARQQVTNQPDPEPVGDKANFSGLRDVLPKPPKLGDQSTVPMPPPQPPPQMPPPPVAEVPPPDNEVGGLSPEADPNAIPEPIRTEPPTAEMSDGGPNANALPAVAPAPKTSARNAEKIRNVDQELADIHASRPEAPKSNWGQRLGTAILAMTKLAPMTNEIVHPKWSAENRAYQGTLADTQQRQKEQETAASTEATIAQKEAIAEERKMRGEDYGAREKERLDAVKARIAEMKSKRNQAFITERLKGREADATYQPKEQQRPDGFDFVEDPEHPGFGYVVPPTHRLAPPELLPFLPGTKPGEMVSNTEYKAAVNAARQASLEDRKAENRHEPNPTEASLALQQARDENPGASEAVIAKRARSLMTQDKIAGRPVNSTTFIAPTNAPEGAAKIEDVPDGIRGQVQQVIDGDMKLPSAARSNPTNQAIRYWVTKVDSRFSEQRYGVKDSFMKGKDADNVKSLNTVIGHLGALSDNAAKLGNTDFRKYNGFGNWLQREAGSDQTAPFRVDRRGVASELSTALKGGVASQAEVEGWLHEIDASDTPGTLKNTIKEIAHVIGSRMDALEEKRSVLPERSRERPLLSAKSKTVMDRLTGGGQQQPQGGAPKPIVQKSEKTGAYRHSLDGGQTWRPGQP